MQEVSGRIIRVEFAKRFRRPPPPPPPNTPSPKETRHKLYVSNLAWKVRSTHLRELFSENFKPVSSRVVFESPSDRSAGYGFVSFATREEAEAAISALDGKVMPEQNYMNSFMSHFWFANCCLCVNSTLHDTLTASTGSLGYHIHGSYFIAIIVPWNVI